MDVCSLSSAPPSHQKFSARLHSYVRVCLQEDRINLSVVLTVFMGMALYPLTYGMACRIIFARSPVMVEASDPWAARYFLPLERWLALFGLPLWDDAHARIASKPRLFIFLTALLIAYCASVWALCVGLWRTMVW